MRPPPPPPPASALSKQHLLRIRRCLPPVWRNAAPVQDPPPPLPTSPSSPASLSALLFSCTARRAHRPGEQLHARAVALGLGAHPLVLPRLAAFYVALGDLPAARAAVEQAARKARTFPWNLLIWGYTGRGLWGDVILAYERMLALGVLYGLDMYVWNMLVGMYAKCRELDDARRVFDGMPVRDVVSWNTIVFAYASASMRGEAFELLLRVPGANIVTWNAVAAGNLKAGNYNEVTRLVSLMRSCHCHGLGLDYVTLVIGLKASARSGYLRVGRELHGVAVCLCFDKLEHVQNSLIHP